MSRKHLTFFLCFLYVGLAVLYIIKPIRLVAPPPAGDVSAFTRELDARMPRSLREARAPGASVALIRGGEVVWSNGYGLADVQTRTPVTARTIFQAASISKTVTAWGVMKLVEDGRLALDAPAESYLTRWHLPSSVFDANGVTIRRLLSHTSGLIDVQYLGYPPGQPLPSLEESLANGPPAPTDKMKEAPGSTSIGKVRIVAPPGQAYVYSDANYVLLQLIIEEVTGESFADYMQRDVLSPLGMSDSSFARSPELIARTATPYDVYANPLPDHPFTELAPAGLYTTAPDLARFVASGLPGANGEPKGRGVLSPASLDLMTTPAVSIPGFDGWIYADAYGLGYFIETQPDGGRLISHMGGNLGWMCEFAAFPSTGDGIVIMTNSSAGQEVFADALTAWTDWLGRDEAHVARAIHVARRLFGTMAFSMMLAAAILFTRLVIGVRSGQRRFDFAHLPLRRIVGAAISIAMLILYWTVLNSLMQINVPSQASEMLLGVNLLGLATLFDTLFSKKS